jgi:hypothetical protein
MEPLHTDPRHDDRRSFRRLTARRLATRRNHRPLFELLEDRNLPSVSFAPDPVHLGKHIVQFQEDIAGTNDVLQWSVTAGGELAYQWNSAPLSTDLDTATPGIQALSFSAISHLKALLGGGNDRLILNAAGGLPIPALSGAAFHGGSGVDTIEVAFDANMTLTNTSLVITPGGAVALDGVEQAHLTGGNSPNILDASLFTAGSVSLFGGNQKDLITGGSGDDFLDGGAGDDVLDGGAGNDVLDSTNSGNAFLFGGPGHDTLLGGNGRDTLDGGEGNDTLIGNNGRTPSLAALATTSSREAPATICSTAARATTPSANSPSPILHSPTPPLSDAARTRLSASSAANCLATKTSTFSTRPCSAVP